MKMAALRAIFRTARDLTLTEAELRGRATLLDAAGFA
jgi:hypothetical protein